MSARGPWYISARAVREYLALLRRPDDDGGPEWERATDELVAAAEWCVDNREPKRLPSGLLEYRGPRPLRLKFVVSTEERSEGRLPQLVSVRGSHAGGGVGAGRRRK